VDGTDTARLMRAFMDVPALIAVLRGPGYVYEFANHAYRRAVRVPEPIVGKPFGLASAGAGLKGFVGRLDEVRATGEPQRLPEVRVTNPGDAEKFYDVMLEPIRDDGGAVDRILIQSTDITDQVLARRRLEESQRQLIQVQKLESLGVLAGGIAHDFNNLLTAIVGGASTALLALPNGSAAAQAIQCVLVGARSATELTRQLLAYAGKGHVEVKAIDLSAQVRELAALLETTVPKKVQLRLQLTTDLPAIEADIAQVQQVLMNLVVNGAEAIGDQRGTVVVTTGVQVVDADSAATLCPPAELPSAEYVFLEVSDTGVGMDEATLERIFDPFYTTKFTGRGLGLAAVLGIVRAHKGALKVSSRPGFGTTFRVFFPVSDRAPTSGGADLVDTFRGTGTILVVDDDPGVRRALQMLLEHFGFEVVEASDGRKGIHEFAARGGDFAAVILDMTMPDMGGEETFLELRRLRGEVPVILASGYSEAEATRRFTTGGLAGFLPKPFTAAELAAKLRATIEPGASLRRSSQ